MEIKEINSSIVNQLLGRINSADVIGEGFAQLLARNEPDQTVSAQKAESSSRRAEKADSRNNDGNVRENTGADKKSKASREDKNDKTNSRGEASAAAAEKSPAEKTDGRIEKDNAPVKENASQNDKESADVDAAGQDVTDRAENVARVISLAELAGMGIVNVLNPLTGNIEAVDGAELAAALSEEPGLMIVSPEGGEQPLQIIPANENRKNIDISGMLPTEGDDSFDAVLAAKAGAAQQKEVKEAVLHKEILGAAADSKTAEQAAKLSEVIGAEQKMKITVETREEEVSLKSARDLLADVKAVEEAALVSEGTPVAKTAVQSENTPANLNKSQYQMQPQAAAVQANVPLQQPAGSDAAPAQAQVSAVVDGALSALPHAAAGSEFVQAARAEAANQNTQTSFRDVYKGMSREVVEQVKVNITKSAVKGVDKIDISLKPEDLGHIEIKMQLGKDGKLSAHIISSRPETMEALQKEMQSLEKAFNDAGFQTDEGSFSFSYRDQAGQNQERENGLRNFIGDIFEKETSIDLVSGDMFQPQTWDGKSGLNIRV